MEIAELIAKSCDADRNQRPLIPVWILASRAYGIAETVHLLERIMVSKN